MMERHEDTIETVPDSWRSHFFVSLGRGVKLSNVKAYVAPGLTKSGG